MKRIISSPRKDWEKKVEEVGLVYHSIDNIPYWDESAYYSFTSKEIDVLETATQTLHEMCLEAGQYIIDKNRFAEMGIPSVAVPHIVSSWNEEPPSIYGRFDLAYDGKSPPKLLEYNADTPTSLLEAGVIQWSWLQEFAPKKDQFNSIHEKLIEKWKELSRYIRGTLYFCSADSYEDIMTVSYLRDTAEQGGITCSSIGMEEIGWKNEEFCDTEENPIKSLFKLYPWEWLYNEDAYKINAQLGQTIFMEPAWKMMWSNKGLLPILWEMFPNHELLLEAHFNDPKGMKNYVKKPLLSREGANIEVVAEGYGSMGKLKTDGPYGAEGFICQAFNKLPTFDDNFAVIGSWYIMDQGPAGIGIRESKEMITANTSRFLPHLIEG